MIPISNNKRIMIMMIILVFLINECWETMSFVSNPILIRSFSNTISSSSSKTIMNLSLIPELSVLSSSASSSLLQVAAEQQQQQQSLSLSSLRQYVPLVVSCLVILDILLGSPAANSVMKILRSTESKDLSENSHQDNVTKNKTTSLSSSSITTTERIDSMALAQAALDKANATLELKRFLEDSKTDWDRMEEIRKKMDQQMQQFDDKKMMMKQNPTKEQS